VFAMSGLFVWKLGGGTARKGVGGRGNFASLRKKKYNKTLSAETGERRERGGFQSLR